MIAVTAMKFGTPILRLVNSITRTGSTRYGNEDGGITPGRRYVTGVRIGRVGYSVDDWRCAPTVLCGRPYGSPGGEVAAAGVAPKCAGRTEHAERPVAEEGGAEVRVRESEHDRVDQRRELGEESRQRRGHRVGGAYRTELAYQRDYRVRRPRGQVNKDQRHDDLRRADVGAAPEPPQRVRRRSDAHQRAAAAKHVDQDHGVADKDRPDRQ